MITKGSRDREESRSSFTGGVLGCDLTVSLFRVVPRWKEDVERIIAVATIPRWRLYLTICCITYRTSLFAFVRIEMIESLEMSFFKVA